MSQRKTKGVRRPKCDVRSCCQIDSAFSMTPFSDEFVSGSVNSLHTDDERAVFVNYTILVSPSARRRRPLGADQS